MKIEQLNVNKFSYLKNKFPVEVLLNYQGKKRISSQFSIYNNGTSLFSKKIQFSPTNNSKTILTNLTSNKKGLQYYTASIKEIKGEKNIKNNNIYLLNFIIIIINFFSSFFSNFFGCFFIFFCLSHFLLFSSLAFLDLFFSIFELNSKAYIGNSFQIFEPMKFISSSHCLFYL